MELPDIVWVLPDFTKLYLKLPKSVSVLPEITQKETARRKSCGHHVRPERIS